MVRDFEEHIAEGPTLIAANGRTDDLAAAIAGSAVDASVRLRGTPYESVLFTPPGASRETALRTLQVRLDIERRSTLAVVVANEAISLFSAAGVRVARASADERVKLAADRAFEEHEVDDVARTLNEFVPTTSDRTDAWNSDPEGRK